MKTPNLSDSDVSAVNYTMAVVLMDDGEEVPVSNWFDDEGDELDGPDGAVFLVAGPTKDGTWLTVDLTEFEDVTLN